MSCTVDDSTGTGRALTNDVTNLSFDIPSGVQDVSGINYSANERLLLRGDMSVTLNGVFNDAVTTQEHVVFKNYRTLAAGQTGRTTAIAISGQTLSDEILYSNYAMTMAADGSFTWSAPGSLSSATGTAPAWS